MIIGESTKKLNASIMIISAKALQFVEKDGQPTSLDGEDLRIMAYKDRAALVEKVAKVLYDFDTPNVCPAANDWERHSEAYKAIYYRSAEFVVNAIVGPPTDNEQDRK